ncbi:MAG: redoxin family protein [Gemmataceae bacterium]
MWRIALVSLCLVHSATAAEVKLSDKVADIKFRDIHYLTRSLEDLPGKAVVFVFMDTGCPVAARYVPELKKLETEFRDKGVRFVALFPGAEDSIAALASFAVKHDIAFPCGKDYDAACATALGVTRTPEVAVLDSDHKLRYRGRIDDQYYPGGTRPKPTRQDLREAIDAALAGKQVAQPITVAEGCPITQPTKAMADKTLTFAEHVAPILHKHCQECHRPNTVAPFSLVDYTQVNARAKAIADVVRDGSMPPWYGAPEHQEFNNRRGLSSEEKSTLLAWLKSDRPVGDLTKVLAPLPAAPEWRIGTPDMVLKAQEHELPDSGDVAYKYAILPFVFTHDTWVDGVEIKPDNRRVLHHCNMAFAKIGEKFSVQNFITGAVPGGEALTLPAGVAVKIPAGAILILQIHYITTGKPEKCRISVGFRYPRVDVQQQLKLSYVATTRYAIPPGAPAHRVAASRTLPCDAIGVGMFAHMHVRGRDMTFLAHTPDGKTEDLLTVPNYSFAWQHAYRWEFGAKKLPKGTKLECVAHYDNSPFNPFNPDPKATVLDGDQTAQEMLNGFIFYVDANEQLKLKIDPKTGGEAKN